LTVRLLRKWIWNITDLSIELQSLFKDGENAPRTRSKIEGPKVLVADCATPCTIVV